MFYRLKNYECPISGNWTFCVDSGMKRRKVFLLNLKSSLFVFCLFLFCSVVVDFFSNTWTPFRIILYCYCTTRVSLLSISSTHTHYCNISKDFTLTLYSLIHLFNVKILMWPGSWQCKHPLQPSFPWRRWIGALKRCQCCKQLQRKSYCCCRKSCKLSSQGLSVIMG